jgi:predicted flap endonuclease-1-like 5' DNA nuclease
MSYQNSDGMSCARVCWLLGAAVGVLTFIVLLWVYQYSGLPAFFWGLVIFVIAGWLLGKLFCSGEVAAQTQVSTPASAPATKPVEAAKPVQASKPVAAAKPVETTKPVAAKKPAAAKKPTPAPAANPKEAPKDTGSSMLTKPRDGGKDDLKKIKGVGPGLEKTLNELGIFHYDQVAKWDADDIAWVDDRLKFKGRIVRDDWVGQAKDFAQAG